MKTMTVAATKPGNQDTFLLGCLNQVQVSDEPDEEDHIHFIQNGIMSQKAA